MPHRVTSVLFAALFAVAALSGGCSAEQLFKQGRVGEPCAAVYPTCHAGYTAGCYLDEGSYAEGVFPGDRRVLVTTSRVNQTIRVRLFLKNMIFPGTEILVSAYESDCGDVSRDHREGVDVFDEAGDDRTIIFDLEATTPGDHLVEFFSDCAAEYVLIAEAQQPSDD